MATIVKADTLATVALVIAILSFGAQLVVTAAQTAAANDQYRQVTRLYEDTRSVLQRIRAQTKMLLSNQSEQFNKILDHVLSPSAIESAVAEVRSVNEDSASPTSEPATPTADANEIAKLLRAQADRALAEDRTRRPTQTSRRVVPDDAELRRFPREDEGREVLDRLEGLGEEAQGYIRELAETAGANPEKTLRLAQIVQDGEGELPSFYKDLEQAGFVLLEPVRRDGKTETGRRLMPPIFIAIRFFTGQGIVPSYLRGMFESNAATRPPRRQSKS